MSKLARQSSYGIRHVVVFALLVAALLPISAGAQDSPSGATTITLFPATVRLDPVPAGQTTLQTLTFQNQTGSAQAFSVELQDYKALDAETLEFVPLGATPDSLRGMIDVTPQRFTLENHQSQSILVRINPPETMAAGNYKGVVFVGPTQDDETDTSVRVAGRVGSLFGVVVTNPLPSPAPPSIYDQLQRHQALTVAGGAALALLLLVIVAASRASRTRRGKRRRVDEY